MGDPDVGYDYESLMLAGTDDDDDEEGMTGGDDDDGGDGAEDSEEEEEEEAPKVKRARVTKGVVGARAEPGGWQGWGAGPQAGSVWGALSTSQ